MFQRKWALSRNIEPESFSSQLIQREYWKIVQTGTEEIEVEYANDLDTKEVGSGFPCSGENTSCSNQIRNDQSEEFVADSREYYENTGWNLNNFPNIFGSLLRHVHTEMKGINIPWLYAGMLFASFCWHTEDNYMYSVNYQHFGAKKRWYGIPASDLEKFEKLWQAYIPERFQEEPGLFFHVSIVVLFFFF